MIKNRFTKHFVYGTFHISGDPWSYKYNVVKLFPWRRHTVAKRLYFMSPSAHKIKSTRHVIFQVIILVFYSKFDKKQNYLSQSEKLRCNTLATSTDAHSTYWTRLQTAWVVWNRLYGEMMRQDATSVWAFIGNNKHQCFAAYFWH